MKMTDNGVNKEKLTFPAPEEKKTKEVRERDISEKNRISTGRERRRLSPATIVTGVFCCTVLCDYRGTERVNECYSRNVNRSRDFAA